MEPAVTAAEGGVVKAGAATAEMAVAAPVAVVAMAPAPAASKAKAMGAALEAAMAKAVAEASVAREAAAEGAQMVAASPREYLGPVQRQMTRVGQQYFVVPSRLHCQPLARPWTRLRARLA